MDFEGSYKNLYKVYKGLWGFIIYKGFKEDYTRFKVDLWVGYRDSRSITPISLTFIGIIRIYIHIYGL